MRAELFNKVREKNSSVTSSSLKIRKSPATTKVLTFWYSFQACILLSVLSFFGSFILFPFCGLLRALAPLFCCSFRFVFPFAVNSLENG